MNKVDIFKKEISYVKEERYKEDLIKLINELPDYFFEIPASSTGKYHPKYALGDKGLIRHSKAVTKIGYELLKNNTIGSAFNESQKDLMLIAMILHDGLKSGFEQSKYTLVEHPLLVGELIKNTKDLSLTEGEIDF